MPILIVLLIFFLLLFIYVLSFSLDKIKQFISRKRWIMVQAKILESKVIPDDVNTAEIKYQYTYQNNEYRSTEIRLGGFIYYSDKQSVKLVERYDVDKIVPAFIDPLKPSNSCLEMGNTFLPYIFGIIVASGFLIIPIYFLVTSLIK